MVDRKVVEKLVQAGLQAVNIAKSVVQQLAAPKSEASKALSSMNRANTAPPKPPGMVSGMPTGGVTSAADQLRNVDTTTPTSAKVENTTSSSASALQPMAAPAAATPSKRRTEYNINDHYLFDAAHAQIPPKHIEPSFEANLRRFQHLMGFDTPDEDIESVRTTARDNLQLAHQVGKDSPDYRHQVKVAAMTFEPHELPQIGLKRQNLRDDEGNSNHSPKIPGDLLTPADVPPSPYINVQDTGEAGILAFDPAAQYTSDEQKQWVEDANHILDNPKATEEEKAYAQAIILQLQYGVTVTINPAGTESMSWKQFLDTFDARSKKAWLSDKEQFFKNQIHNIYYAVQMVETAFRSPEFIQQLPEYMQGIRHYLPGELFKFLMGNVDIDVYGAHGKSNTLEETTDIQLRGSTFEGLADEGMFAIPIPLIVHELGHAFHNRWLSTDPTKTPYLTNRLDVEQKNWGETGLSRHEESWVRPYNTFGDDKEQFADWFLFWVYEQYPENKTIPLSKVTGLTLTRDTAHIAGIDESTTEGHERGQAMTEYLADQVTILYGRQHPRAIRAKAQEITLGNLVLVSIESTIDLREHPYNTSEISIPESNTKLANFILFEVEQGTTVNFIGSVTATNGQTWYLVEYRGSVGWVSQQELRASPSVAPLRLSEVQELTGRNYIINENGEWQIAP